MCKYMDIRSRLKNPSQILHLLRCLQILNNSCCNLVQDVLYFSENNALIAIVMQAFVLIRFHKYIVFPMRLSFGLGLCTCTAYLICTYEVSGSYYESSLALIKSLNNFDGNEQDRKLLKVYCKAFQPLKLKIGPFGYFNKRRKIAIIGKIVYYTAKLLMVTRRH